MTYTDYNMRDKERKEARLNVVRNLAAKLLLALEENGEVIANGGSVYRQNPFEYLMSTTDMCDVVRYLAMMSIVVQRVDAGGQPTWRL
jgi:hypothetical protein